MIKNSHWCFIALETKPQNLLKACEQPDLHLPPQASLLPSPSCSFKPHWLPGCSLKPPPLFLPQPLYICGSIHLDSSSQTLSHHSLHRIQNSVITCYFWREASLDHRFSRRLANTQVLHHPSSLVLSYFKALVLDIYDALWLPSFLLVWANFRTSQGRN